MKTIGLIGGMSWESTVTYYQIINRVVQSRLGGFHSAKILLYSVDFSEIEECQVKGDWDKSTDILATAAKNLETAGADFIVICTNTMHKVAPQIQERIGIPVVHIAEAAAQAINAGQISRAALLGTKYTMTQAFYKDKLLSAGIDVIIPDEEDMEFVNHVIFDELCLGTVSDKSRQGFLRIIDKLADKGAQAIVLGCTEIGLLIRPEDTRLPVFDTTDIHATKAALLSIGE
ncbi:MAG: aspartate/glutamate racemase family protein [Clostridia bacterium]|nr:aspartate/glutamate racemase family protein [Clostridia bacterium]